MGAADRVGPEAVRWGLSANGKSGSSAAGGNNGGGGCEERRRRFRPCSTERRRGMAPLAQTAQIHAGLGGMSWKEMVLMDEQALEAQGVAALDARRKMLKTFEVVRSKMGIDDPTPPPPPPPSSSMSTLAKRWYRRRECMIFLTKHVSPFFVCVLVPVFPSAHDSYLRSSRNLQLDFDPLFLFPCSYTTYIYTTPA